jgi:hypothetical protein
MSAQSGDSNAEGVPAAPPSGWLELLAVIGLFFLWPAGVVLVRRSRVWSRGEKLIGTFVPPGGGTGLPLLVVWWLHQQPPLPNVAAALVLLTVLVNAGLWLAPLLAFGTEVFLAWRARPPHRPRLALVLGIVVAPVAVLTAEGVVVSHLGPFSPEAEQTANAAPSPSPVDIGVGQPGLPDLTPAQLTEGLNGRGFTCDRPIQMIGTWATACRQGSGAVEAIGPNDHTIEVLTATTVPDQAGQFFDAVARSACRPADAGSVAAWVRDHLSGGQTDIDGYDLTIADLAGNSVLSVTRSRP